MRENKIVFLLCTGQDISIQIYSHCEATLTLASMVQPQDTEFKEYEFKIKEFIELLGVKDEKSIL